MGQGRTQRSSLEGGRIRRGDAEGVLPSTLGEGSGEGRGGCAPSPENVRFFSSKSCVSKNFWGANYEFSSLSKVKKHKMHMLSNDEYNDFEQTVNFSLCNLSTTNY